MSNNHDPDKLLRSIEFTRPTLLVLSGFSGAGKTTVRDRIMRALPEAEFSLSVTTRECRADEADGVDYRFISKEEFRGLIDTGGLLEFENVHNNYYGTPREPVEEALKRPGLFIFDVDVHGGLTIKKQYPETILVFLKPPDIDELKRRLKNRKSESREKIEHRLERIPVEDELSQRYDHIVVNDDLDRAVETIARLIEYHQK